MERLDEQEMLIQYSEMTAFDFNSEEFRKVKKDYLECKSFISNFALLITNFINKFTPTQNY
jgi:hypothetical protein